MGFEAALGNLACVSQSLFVDMEGLFRIVAKQFLEACDGFGAQLGAVRGRIIGLARGRPAIRVSTLMSFGWFGAASRALAMVSARPSTSSL